MSRIYMHPKPRQRRNPATEVPEYTMRHVRSQYRHTRLMLDSLDIPLRERRKLARFTAVAVLLVGWRS